MRGLMQGLIRRAAAIVNLHTLIASLIHPAAVATAENVSAPPSLISSCPAGLSSIVDSVEDSQAPQRLGGLAIAGDRTVEAAYAASVPTGSGILEGGALGILISEHLSHSGWFSTIGALQDSAELGVRACEEIPGIGAWSICHAIDGRTYQYAIYSCVETDSSNLPESHVFYKAESLVQARTALSCRSLRVHATLKGNLPVNDAAVANSQDHHARGAVLVPSGVATKLLNEEFRQASSAMDTRP